MGKAKKGYKKPMAEKTAIMVSVFFLSSKKARNLSNAPLVSLTSLCLSRHSLGSKPFKGGRISIS
jgi:hypothetical protein